MHFNVMVFCFLSYLSLKARLSCPDPFVLFFYYLCHWVVVLNVDGPFHTFAGGHLCHPRLLSLLLLLPGLKLSSLELCIIFLGAHVLLARRSWPPFLPF